jgi:hypothetical protein
MSAPENAANCGTGILANDSNDRSMLIVFRTSLLHTAAPSDPTPQRIEKIPSIRKIRDKPLR